MALINCPECDKEISDKAGACPSCGCPAEKPVTIATPLPDYNKKTCPSCSSENTQTIKMAVMSGTTTSKSLGIGFTGGLDVGIAAIGTKGSTELAASLKPGTKPAVYPPSGFLVFSAIASGLTGIYLFTSDTKLFGAILLGLSALLCLLVWAFKKDATNPVTPVEAQIWAKKNKLHNSGWLCHKCGNTWIP